MVETCRFCKVTPSVGYIRAGPGIQVDVFAPRLKSGHFPSRRVPAFPLPACRDCVDINYLILRAPIDGKGCHQEYWPQELWGIDVGDPVNESEHRDFHHENVPHVHRALYHA